MNDNILLKAVLVKYEITEPLPADVRMAMNRSKKENLKAIVRKQAGGAFMTGAVVGLFLRVKKYGISMTFTGSAVAVSAAALTVAAVIAVTASRVVTSIVSAPAGVLPPQEQLQQVPGVIAVGDENAERSVVSYSVAVERVVMAGAPAAKKSDYTRAIINELRSIRGSQAAISSGSIDRYHVAGKLLSVSIIELRDADGAGSVFRISAKVISVDNSRVLLYVSETAKNDALVIDTLKLLMTRVAAVL